jgi:hypothetical protein
MAGRDVQDAALLLHGYLVGAFMREKAAGRAILLVENVEIEYDAKGAPCGAIFVLKSGARLRMTVVPVESSP